MRRTLSKISQGAVASRTKQKKTNIGQIEVGQIAIYHGNCTRKVHGYYGTPIGSGGSRISGKGCGEWLKATKGWGATKKI